MMGAGSDNEIAEYAEMDDLESQEEIRKVFKEDELADYDFSPAPGLVRARNRNALIGGVFGEHDVSRWVRSQHSFLGWTRDKRIFTREYIESRKGAFDAFFAKRGPLRGRILDVGGGWGLFRQWWNTAESNLFIVHDPGIERYLRGPYELHRHYYQKAFSVPMIFVEGFGEKLPYRDNVFDISLVAATLDHCIDPQRVIAEGYRCVKPGGSMLVIEGCRSSESNTERLSLWKRLRRHTPRDLMGILYYHVFHPDVGHLHQFTGADVKMLLEQARFSNIITDAIPNLPNYYAFEARKIP